MSDASNVDEEQVGKGLTMLWIALAGSIVMLPLLAAPKLVWLFMMAWVASVFGGLGGIREVARGTQGSALLMYLALVGVFMPFVNIAVIGFYIVVGRGALRSGDTAAPLERALAPAARTPAATKPAPAAPPASATRAPPVASPSPEAGPAMAAGAGRASGSRPAGRKLSSRAPSHASGRPDCRARTGET